MNEDSYVRRSLERQGKTKIQYRPNTMQLIFDIAFLPYACQAQRCTYGADSMVLQSIVGK